MFRETYLWGMGNKVHITLEEYSYHCGDGCCFNYGTRVTVNGVRTPSDNQDVQTILEEVLTILGYKATIETIENHE
jgi:hypothetical protein